MANDEDRPLGPCEEPPEALHIAEPRLVEALAAGEAVLTRPAALPRAIVVDRPAFELAHVDVVEERLAREGDGAALERSLGGLKRAVEARVHAELERDSGDFQSQATCLLDPLSVSGTWTDGSPFTRCSSFSRECA